MSKIKYKSPLLNKEYLKKKVNLIDDICLKYKIPNSYKKFSKSAIIFYINILSVKPRSNEDLLVAFGSLGTLRKVELFCDFLIIYKVNSVYDCFLLNNYKCYNQKVLKEFFYIIKGIKLKNVSNDISFDIKKYLHKKKLKRINMYIDKVK